MDRHPGRAEANSALPFFWAPGPLFTGLLRLGDSRGQIRQALDASDAVDRVDLVDRSALPSRLPRPFSSPRNSPTSLCALCVLCVEKGNFGPVQEPARAIYGRGADEAKARGLKFRTEERPRIPSILSENWGPGLGRISHEFSSRGAGGAVMTRRATEAPADVLYGTSRRPTERNAVRADDCGPAVENS